MIIIVEKIDELRQCVWQIILNKKFLICLFLVYLKKYTFLIGTYSL